MNLKCHIQIISFKRDKKSQCDFFPKFEHTFLNCKNMLTSRLVISIIAIFFSFYGNVMGNTQTYYYCEVFGLLFSWHVFLKINNLHHLQKSKLTVTATVNAIFVECKKLESNQLLLIYIKCTNSNIQNPQHQTVNIVDNT